MSVTEMIQVIDKAVWGVPLIVLILGCGIWLTVRSGLVQLRHLGRALKYMVKNEEEGEGEVTSFGALCTALSATIGTGNIVGVATAIAAGGPGALFWMEVAAFFGMATKYAEGVLSIKYRTIDADGHVLGGPFYYIERGMGKRWTWLAKLFAFFGAMAGLLGIGTITQVNGITSAVQTFFDPEQSYVLVNIGGNHPVTVAAAIAGVLVAILVALVVIGGIRRISGVSQIVVPFMAILYVICGLAILLTHLNQIPGAVVEIVSSAFGLRAVSGGVLGAMLAAMQNGVARGIFSNEAGLGSAPIASAAAQTKDPVRQGLVTMTGTFIDTIVICTMTGLSIVIAGSWNTGKEGVDITIDAFRYGLPYGESIAALVLMICLVFFAFTTILGWDYYGERCLEYLSGRSMGAVKVYRWLYILAVFVGPYLTVEVVWTVADIFNAFMAVPNIVALLALSGVVAAETKKFVEEGRHLVH